MAEVIGKVEELDGKFYIQDENGNIEELQVGDQVKENEIVFGDDKNLATSKIVISLIGSQDTLEVLSNNQLKLDTTLLDEIPENDLKATTKESLNDAIEKLGEYTQDIIAKQEEEVDTQIKNVKQPSDEDEDILDLDFIDRAINEIDINSNLGASSVLNQTKFHGFKEGISGDFGNFISSTGNETDINTELRDTDNGGSTDNDDGADIGGAIFAKISLLGDVIVGEGGTATYILSLDEPPKSDFTVTLRVSHISTDDIDLSEETIVINIPAEVSSKEFTIDNFNDTPYDDSEKYSVTIVSVSQEGYAGVVITNDEVITEITDSLTLPVLSIDDQTVYEDEGLMTFTVSLDKVAEDDVTFDCTSSDNDTTSGNDYTSVNITGLTIPAGSTSVTFTVSILDDYLADNAETFNINLSNVSANAVIGDGIGVGTILDNSQANTPNDSSDDTVEDNIDAITIKLFAIDATDGSRKSANEVNEGENPEYIAVAFDKNNNEISISGTVEVTFGKIGDSATANIDYNSTTQTVTLGVKFNTNSIDDYVADSGENYQIQITDNSLSTAASYETVEIDTTSVTTTIVDNSQPNTPNNHSDDTVELNSESVVVKLVSTDNLGNIISPVTIGEGQTAYYKAILVDPDGNQIVGATGDVDVTFTDDTAIRTGTSANGELDFSATNQTIALNTVFSANSLDDYIKDSGETFNVQIVDDTYTNANSYETVTHDITPVVTTITDGVSESDGGATANDSVFLQLDTNDSVDEANSATLTHQFHLVDKDDNPINLANSETITVTLTYSADSTENEDFSDKKTTVTITGNGGSTYSFDNTIVDDFLNEGDEVYTVSISSIDTNNTSFENIKIADTSNGANSTVNSATGTIRDGVNDAIPNEVDNDTVYAVLTGDLTVIEGNSASYTVELLDIDGNSVDVSQDTVVNITFTNGTTQDADTEYSNNQIIPVTILANSSSVTFNTDTIDDYMADSSENYTLSISSIPTHEFEAVDIDGFIDSITTTHVSSQTTTISDNTGTPNNDTTDEIENSESPALSLDVVEIKLIACDTSGNKLVDGSGNYILVNSVYEGDSPNYMALAFVPGTTVFNASNETPTQEGTVDITFFKDVGDTADGISTASSTITPTLDTTHVQDYDIDALSGVSLGVAFSTKVFDDFKADDGETFSVRIDDGSYTPPTPTTGYENVNVDTTAVVTTINDDVTFGTPDDAYVDEDVFDVTNSSITLVGKEHTTSGGGLDVTGNGTTGNDTLLNIDTSPVNYNDYTFSFDSAITLNSDNQTNTSLVSTGNSNFTSGGVNIEYVVSGTTITAYKGAGRATSDKVFDIILEKNGAGGADDGYTYTQYKNIDHPTNSGIDDDTLTLTFGYTITNDGQTSQIQNFDVVVNDSLPFGSNQSLSVDEDDTLLIVISDESFVSGQITLNNGVEDASGNPAGPAAGQLLNSGDTMNIYGIGGDDVIGTVLNNSDGTLTFTPFSNYSGGITPFSYLVADSDGDGANASIDITINPIADTPGISLNLVSINEDNNNITDDGDAPGEYTVSMQLELPTLSSDTIDQNDADVSDSSGTTAGDEPERLGYIELRFTNGSAVSGAVVSDGSNNFTINNDDDTLLLYITNLTNGDTSTQYHHSGLNPATDSGTIWQITQAEYEALTITHAEDNDTDIDFDISVTSYEVDSLRAPISPEESETTTVSTTINIEPATDDITLAWDDNSRGVISTTTNTNDTYTFTGINEGDALRVIDLQSLLTKTSGYETDTFGDLDGTEKRSYTISGIPNGTSVNLGGTIAIATGGTSDTSLDGSVTVTFSIASNLLEDPTFSMTLPEHYNGNITNGVITLRVTDTGVDVDDTSSSEKTASVNFSIEVTAVTDPVTITPTITYVDEDAVSTATPKEDGTYSISINFTTIDDLDASGDYANDGPNGNNTDFDFVQGAADDTVVSDITISYTSGIKGTISWDGGTHNYVTDGDDAIIPFDKLDTLTFIPEANLSGNVTLSYTVYIKEEDASNIVTESSTLSFDVEPVADGLTFPNLGANGFEDDLTAPVGMIELFSNLNSSESMDIITAVVNETIQTFEIDGVPDGFLIKVGATGATLATNLGDNGSGQTFDLHGNGSQNVGFNTWSIDTSSGIPQIWIEAPANWGSNTPLNLTLITTVDDNGDTKTVQEPFDVIFAPVADDITIAPTDTSGQALNDIDINLGAVVNDLDGSETVTMTLEGLDADATFKVDGYAISSTYSSAAGGTHVIEGIVATDINNITFAVPDDISRDGIITVKTKMVEVNGLESAEQTATFNLTVSGIGATVPPLTPITNSLIGNQTLDITAVNNATDDNNSLTVYDATSVTFTDSGDWSSGIQGTSLEEGFTIYTHTSGSRVLVENQVSFGDDILSFKDTNAIDAFEGNDTVILAGELIDYSKLSNIENIDLSAEKNTLSNLTLSDVINMTDDDNDLKILGDTADSVEFEAGNGWVKQGTQVVEDGNTFDVYTNTSDSSVSVKVEDNINDQII